MSRYLIDRIAALSNVDADRRSLISVADAEKETDITQQQVSRWRKALRNEEKYQDALRGPSYKLASVCSGTVSLARMSWPK
jgi:hypothetical protein